jgi:hypothetical protein
MQRFLTLLVLVLGLTVPTVAFAEEPAAAEASEEAAPASDEAAPEGEDAAAPAGEDEAAGDEEVPETLDAAADDISLLVKAVQDKNWSLALGFLLMLLVMVANKFGLKDKIGSKAVPWVAMGLAVAATLGIGLANGLVLVEAGMQGVLAGVAAIGGWELLFKHILQSKPAAE